MVFSLLVFNFNTPQNAPVANAAPIFTTGVLGKVSDIDTSNFLFLDASFNINPAYPYVNSPSNDGRMWTDKSVNSDQAFIYDSTGGVIDVVNATDDEFLVTLSALSQTINSQNIIVEPSDTVFVIDVSGSMATNTVPGDGRSRVAVVIDALNDAINMLMAADENNRISVVIYGGQSVSGQNQAKVYPILPLGRYVITPPIFSVSGTTVTVNSAIASPLQRTFTVEGGTPTQLGIRRGADVLLGVNKGLDGGNGTLFDTGVPDPGAAEGNVIVTRKPNIILMTDGEPTYAWLDHTMGNFKNWQGVTNTSNWYDVGNGSNGDMGLTALTVMTAAYVKQEVRDHYYGTLASNPENASKSVGFYTLGLGVNSTIANAMLDPYGKSASGQTNAALVTQVHPAGGTTYNMLTVLNNFVNPPAFGSGSFPYLNRGSSSARTLTTRTNADGFIQTCNYDTMSFTAMDKEGLDDAFNQITQQIVTQGNYTTDVVGGKSEFSGYLAFSDVIGEYMKFESFKGLWYENNQYRTLNSLTAPQRTAFVENFAKFQGYSGIGPGGDDPAPPEFIAAVNDMIDNDLANGNIASGKIVYYANKSRDFMGAYNDSTPGAGKGVLPAPTTLPDDVGTPAEAVAKVELYILEGTGADSLTGAPIPLMDIVFYVITALKDGDFETTAITTITPTLRAGDQIVRWYIPAALIPLRSVETDPADPTTITAIKEAVPIRAIYSVTPDEDEINTNLAPEYIDANKAPGENSYFFYTNRWRGQNGAVTAGDLGNMTLSYFVPSGDNTYYNGAIDGLGVPKQPNVTGPTGTAPFSIQASHFYNGASRVQVQRLGNNGRITMEAYMEMYIEKTFNFDAASPELTVDDLVPITFLVIGRTNWINPDTEVFRQVINFDPSWESTTSPVRRITYTSPSIKLPPIPAWYRVIETGGFALNHGYIPPSMDMGLNLPLASGDPFTFSLANTYIELPEPTDPPALNLDLYKLFHGLLPDEVLELTGFSLKIYGPEGYVEGDDEYYENSFSLSDVADGAGRPKLISIKDLTPGLYFIEENSYEIPGYTTTIKIDGIEQTADDQPFEYDLTDEDGTIMIIIDNFYDIIIYTHEITIEKQVSGLTGSDVAGNPNVPSGLVFKLERLGLDNEGDEVTEFLQTIPYEDMLPSGRITLTGLLPGKYRLTELGGSVGDFDGPKVSVSIDGTPAANPAEFPISDGANTSITVRFTNEYEPEPPPVTIPPETTPPETIPPETIPPETVPPETVPPETVPPPTTPPTTPPAQTGDDSSLLFPVLAISFGVICIGGAELYRRSIKKKNEQK